MRCLGRTKHFNRCKNQAIFFGVCAVHKRPLFGVLLAVISATFSFILGYDTIKKFVTVEIPSWFASKSEFSNDINTYKVLILPFHPRQSCADRNFSVEIEV